MAGGGSGGRDGAEFVKELLAVRMRVSVTGRGSDMAGAGMTIW